MAEQVYKSALEKAQADIEEGKIDEEQLQTVEKDEKTRDHLKELGYTDEEIGEISGEDFDLAKRFFERFPKKEKTEEPKPEEKPEEKEPEAE